MFVPLCPAFVHLVVMVSLGNRTWKVLGAEKIPSNMLSSRESSW